MGKIVLRNPNEYLFKTGKPTGKRPLGRSRRRWEDNIRMDLNQASVYDLILRHIILVMHSRQLI